MEQENKSHAFVFDADGVVIHPWGFAEALQGDYSIARADTRDFFVGPFKQCLTGNAELEKSIAPYLDKWKWPDTVEAFIDIWMDSDNKPNIQVLDHIRGLRKAGAKCYLASNQEQNRAAYIRERMAFESIFDELFFSCELGYLKPDRQFFDTITSKIDVEPNEIHFWDDSESYVHGARSAGWNAHLYESVESLNIDQHA